MKTKSLGFIGGGRITRIFLQAFVNKKAIFESISVFDSNPATLQALKLKFRLYRQLVRHQKPLKKILSFWPFIRR